MSGSKAALKAAKSALDAGRYDDAIDKSRSILDAEPSNYFAELFLGKALDEKSDLEGAAQAYNRALKLRPADPPAWQGLLAVYGKQRGDKMEEYIHCAEQLAGCLLDQDRSEDQSRLRAVVEKLVAFANKHGTRSQYCRALAMQLPVEVDPTDRRLNGRGSNGVFLALEHVLPHPADTYQKIATFIEAAEAEQIKRLIAERRTRVGARLTQVTAEVKREVFGKSNLDILLKGVIEWTRDDAIRRECEERRFQRAYDFLLVLPGGSEEKTAVRKEVLDMADGFVIIKHPLELAWTLKLEWADVSSLGELDASMVREFMEFFPQNGLAKVLRGLLKTDISPFAQPEPLDSVSDDDEEEGGVSLLAPEDPLMIMVEGESEAKNSPLAHKITGDYYLHLEEYESAVETSRKGVKALREEQRKSGLALQNNLDEMNSTLATALIHYQAPRHHAEAKEIFNQILQRNPLSSPALVGSGLVLQEEEQYGEAKQFLSKALARDESNVRVGAELAWCKSLDGDYAAGLKDLEHYLEAMGSKTAQERNLRAQTLYRIGMCMWCLDTSKAARKDRAGAYARFIAAIKCNVNYAPAYASLGIYFEDYAKDTKRARRSFLKAFELSPGEVEAARRLARSYAGAGDWDIVELVAQRVIDSGKTKPSPGSKRKRPVSWPHSALGVVQMNKHEYSQSVISFLAALRISPDDYHSWVGLGESYHNSGRYISAAKAFTHAENPKDGVGFGDPADRWFTKYMHANVNRELGEYDDAVARYREVLDTRPGEFGVEMALLQTLVDMAWRYIDVGFFGRAFDNSVEALELAATVAEHRPGAFNLWKAVGDACAVMSKVYDGSHGFDIGILKRLLEKNVDIKDYGIFSDSDAIDGEHLRHLSTEDQDEDVGPKVLRILLAGVLSHKRAVICCVDNVHAQAVAYYNLGWALHCASTTMETLDVDGTSILPPAKALLKSSLKAIKRAIELEPSNPSFWLGLGVTSTPLNPKVAQHSFVRSLNLNENSARAWTNLGTLYLESEDVELAHRAFSRAQSTDPDFARAWLGEGMVARIAGDASEAEGHFVHAEDIGDEGEAVVKRLYAASVFDDLASPGSLALHGQGHDTVALARPLFVTRQLQTLRPTDLASRHLRGLLLERAGAFEDAMAAFEQVCQAVESEYEATESPVSLGRFAMAKADLARCRLGTKQYAEAAGDADVALSLLDAENGSSSSSSSADGLDAAQRHKIVLSARLSLGLAHYYEHVTTSSSSSSSDQKKINDSIAAFRAALSSTNADPDVVCLLAQLLWAQATDPERDVAREQLLDAAERAPTHVGVRVLLAAIAALQSDWETVDAATEDLMALRAGGGGGSDEGGGGGMTRAEVARVEELLARLAAIRAAERADGDGDDVQARAQSQAMLQHAQRSVMVAPFQASGWRQMAGASEAASDSDVDASSFAAKMALRNAKRLVPPRGDVDAAELAEAFAGTGVIADAQRAVVLAPWDTCGRSALAGGVRAAMSH